MISGRSMTLHHASVSFLENSKHTSNIKGAHKYDLPSVVKKVAAFLGKQLSAEEVLKIADHCSFGSMSKNKAVNNESIAAAESEKAKGLKFMRKGQVGDWKNHLTDAQIKAFKEWTFKHLEGSDFPYYRDYE